MQKFAVYKAEGSIMADNIKIGIQLDDNNSVKKMTSSLKDLRDVLTSIIDKTKEVSIGIQNRIYPSRARTQAANPQGGGGRGRGFFGGGGGGGGRVYASSMSEEPDRSYDQARGAIGTGAAGRDFSKQSAGLGGFVRLYATLAANVYAAGAAFTALSDAADTTIMVASMDQLGARSGRALGSLAKDLVTASEGSISLKEGLEATAKASSAGLSNEQILRMGDAAKKASQTLGVNMTDALSRMSRAISKIEPELVDELGLYTKLDKSIQDYARSVGKSVDSLTDFEKRQAYANALLDEADKKFGALNKIANPYARFSAQLKNIGQSTFEFVNTILTPLVNFMSANPTALMAALAGIGAVLLKQAIPAFGEFKENSQRALNATVLGAAKAADAVNASALKRLGVEKVVALEATKISKKAADKSAADASAAEDSAEKAYKKQEDLFAKAKARAAKLNITGVGSRIAKGILEAPTAAEVDPAAIKSLQQKMSATDLDPVTKKYYKDIVDVTKAAAIEEAKFATAKNLNIQATKNLAVETEKLNRLEAESKKIAEIKHAWWSTAGQNQIRLNNAVSDSIVRNIKNEMQANIDSTGFIKGMGQAYKDLWKSYRQGGSIEIPVLDKFKQDASGKDLLDNLGNKIPQTETKAVKSIGAIRLAFGGLTTGIVGVSSALISVMGIIAPYIAVIGLIIGAMSLIKSSFGATADESEATADALDKLTSAAKNAKDTLKELATKPYEIRLDAESLDARANAVKTTVDSLVKVIRKSFDEIDKMNTVDKVFDAIYSVAGKDVKSTLGKALADNIISAFTLVSETDAVGKTAKASIENILGVSFSDSVAFRKILENVTDDKRQKIMQLIEPLQLLGNTLKSNAAKGLELKAAFEQTNKSWQDFLLSFVNKDATSKFGLDLIKDAGKLAAAVEEPTQSIAAMFAIITDVNKLQLFDPKTVDNLLKVRDEVIKLNSDYVAVGTSIDNTNAKIQQLEAEKAKLGQSLGADMVRYGTAAAGITGGFLAGGLPGAWAGGTAGYALAQAGIDDMAFYAAKDLDKKIAELKNIKDLEVKVRLKLEADAKEVAKTFTDASAALLVKGAETVSKKLNAELTASNAGLVSSIAGMMTDSKAAIQLKYDSDLAVINSQTSLIQSNIDLMIMQKYAADMYEKTTLEARKKELGLEMGEIRTDAQRLEYTSVEKRLARLTQTIEESKGGTVAPKQGISSVEMSRSRAEQKSAGVPLNATLFSEADILVKQKLEGLEIAKKIAGNAAIKTQLDKINALTSEEFKSKQKILDIKKSDLNISSDILNNIKVSGEYGNVEVLQAKNALEIQKQENDFKITNNGLEEAIVKNKTTANFKRDKGLITETTYNDILADIIKQEEIKNQIIGQQADSKSILEEKQKSALAEEIYRVTIGRQLLNIDINKQLAEASVNYVNNYAKVSALLDIEKERFELQKKGTLITKEQDVARAQQALTKAESTDAPDTEKVKALKTAVDAAKEELRLFNERSGKEGTLLKIQQDRTKLTTQEDDKLKQIISDLERRVSLEETTNDLMSARLDNEILIFEAKNANNAFTVQEVQNMQKSFAIRKAEFEFITSKAKLDADATKERSRLNTELAKTPQVELTDEITGSAIFVDSNERSQLLRDLEALELRYGLNLTKVRELNEAKRESIAITNSLSVQEKGFADIFTKGFESMADAMAEFIKTGKMDFKGLINSMIMDLIRFQLRSQMQELAGPGGGANFFAKLLSSAFSGNPTYNTGGVNLPGGFNPDSAKGNVFSSSVQKFASGGAFTNSIVRSPTMIKFANGTGLMGEAGPEAIMPLKRDASGTLGVRGGGQGKVDIVVNNYSGQKAETRETTDSRGNRKIEVVVGEMTAGDISKPGSSSQQALRSNYGLQPALIRR